MLDNYSERTHNELIKILAQNPVDEFAWREFVNRFHQFIYNRIYKQSSKLRFQNGCESIDDIAQEVYEKLVKKNCQALKDFKGCYANSFFKYLEIIIVRTVLNKKKEYDAQKRRSEHDVSSLDTPVKSRNGTKESPLIEMIQTDDWKAIVNDMELRECIEHCLKKIFKNRHKKEQYTLILKYYLFEEMDSRLIAETLGTN